MMQTADFWDGDNAAHRWRFNVPWYRCIAAERAVGSRIVVIGEIRRDDSPKVGLIQNDKMVQTLAPYAAHDSLTIWILPRRSRRD